MKKPYLRLVQVVATGSLLAACGVASDGDDASGVAESALSFDGMTASQVAAARALPDLRVLKVDARGLPRYIEAQLGVLRDDRLVRDGDLAVLRETLAPLLRMGSDDQLVTRSSSRDQQGKVHLRLGQTIAGLEVVNGEIIVHTDGKSGLIESMQLRFLPDEGLLRVPRIAAQDIFAAIPSGELPFPGARPVSAPRLAYFRGPEGSATLGWQVDVSSGDDDPCQTLPGTPPPPPAGGIFVDGSSGHVLRYDSRIKPALYRSVYTQAVDDRCNGPAPLVLRISEGGTTTIPEVRNAYDFSGATYNFFLFAFSRDSWNGNGASMESVIRDIKPDNSFWDGSRALLGSGKPPTFGSFANSIDMVGHEFGHGVIDATANLPYAGESGALNESYADVIGVSTKIRHRGGVIDSDTWKLGADIFTLNTPGDAMRYMNEPTRDAGSFAYTSVDYYPRRLRLSNDQFHDFGGVHFNSGIANLAFYLLSQGGTHPRLNLGITVPGIGHAAALRIWYEALPYLPVDAGFADMRAATAGRALGAAEKAAVCRAWDAVGVPSSDNCPPAPPPITELDPPANVVVASENCGDLNSVTWEGTGSRFEILGYRSGSTTPTVLASKPATPPTTTYSQSIHGQSGMVVRVRACDSGGCSLPSTSSGTTTVRVGCT